VFSVSDQGTALYSTGEHIDGLVWFDRNGNNLGPAVEPGEYLDKALSPDGRLLALVIKDPKTGTGDLWIHDLERGSTDRVTDTLWSEFNPVWSPDGTELVYSADPEGPPNIFVIGVDGGGPRVLVPFDSKVHYPSGWSADGKTILFSRQEAATGGDILSVDAAGGEPRVVVQTEHHESAGVLSPDGRWLAYASRETGDSEVYVQPYGRPGSRQRVSVETGWSPRWEGNSRLVFRARGEKLLSVTLSPDGNRLSIGKPQTFVDFGGESIGEFNLHPDGRILITDHSDDSQTDKTKVVVGWE
jgi:Tol biopolymer transport system component